MTSFTLDSLEAFEIVYAGGASPFEELGGLSDYSPSMIQVSTLERLWFIHVLPRNEHNGAVVGAISDEVNVGRHALGPFMVEGVAVDVNEDPVPGCEVYLLRSDLRRITVIQRTTGGEDGGYLFYVEDPTDSYLVLAFRDAASIKGVTGRDLIPVAS